MKNLKYVLLILTVCCVLFSCKKDKKNSSPKADTTVDNEVNTATAAALDAEPDYIVDLNDIILPNGSKLIDYGLVYDRDWLETNRDLLPSKYQALLTIPLNQVNGVFTAAPVKGPQSFLNNLILEEQVIAENLVNKNSALVSKILAGKQNPAEPNGLAYIYGGKDFTQLRAAADAEPGCCTEKLYGLDCSGFISYLARNVGININMAPDSYPGVSASFQSKAANWMSALQDAGGDYSKLTVQGFTSSQIALTPTDLKCGDMIYFIEKGDNGITGVTHIGIVLNSAGGLMLYNSHGKKKVACSTNYGPNRGPRAVPLSAFDYRQWGFDDYGVVRIEASISGQWQAFIRCNNTTTDAIQLQLNFPVVAGGEFKANGTGTDYDGSPITVKVDGNYDPKKNVLSGNIIYSFPNDPTQQREDSFTTSLSFDDTGYSALTKVIDNGGCNAEIRLVNAQSTGGIPITNSQKSPSVAGISCHCSISGKKKVAIN